VTQPSTIALEVRRWTPLRGRLHQFTTVICDIPEPGPRDADEWRRWAVANLEDIAPRDGWQAGRYHFRAEVRDETDHPVEVLAQDHWQYEGSPA